MVLHGAAWCCVVLLYGIVFWYFIAYSGGVVRWYMVFMGALSDSENGCGGMMVCMVWLDFWCNKNLIRASVHSFLAHE